MASNTKFYRSIMASNTSGEYRDLPVEESGSSLVESVLQTVNAILNTETAPFKLQHDSVNEGYADGSRDEGYVDKEDGYVDNLVEETINQVLHNVDNLVEETINQVLHDRRTDDREEYSMDVNAARLVESVLRTMDSVDVEDESYMDQPTTNSATQNVVDDLMEGIWTEEVVTDASPHGSNTSDMAKDFVVNVVDSFLDSLDLELDSDDSASAQSREFVTEVLQDDQPAASAQSKAFGMDLLGDMKIYLTPNTLN